MTDPKHTEPVVTEHYVPPPLQVGSPVYHKKRADWGLGVISSGPSEDGLWNVTFWDAPVAAGIRPENLVHYADQRHRTAAEAASRAEVERLREALTRHNLRAANGDEITVADEMEQAAGTLEAFVVADKEHSLLDCTDNDGVEYQSALMAGLMDHATINARTLRKWAASLRAALSAAAKGGAA